MRLGHLRLEAGATVVGGKGLLNAMVSRDPFIIISGSVSGGWINRD